MNSHLFLCGLNHEQRASYKNGRALNIGSNVRLKLPALREELTLADPSQLTDLAEIAVYIFAADSAVSRSSEVLENMGVQWRRHFHLVIAVRRPVFWSETQRANALMELLNFATEDHWVLDFVQLVDPTPIQAYLSPLPGKLVPDRETIVVLFSGGLDSFCGALDALNRMRCNVALVSRTFGQGLVDSVQTNLANVLQERYPGRVVHARASAGLTTANQPAETSQRSRSLLFFALALLTAEAVSSQEIRFYENGLMSFNLPISQQVVGARASRTTHPLALFLLSRLALALDRSLVVENPFVWKTKAEVVQELRTLPERTYIAKTISCSNTRGLSHYKPHCGKCAQCVHRRLAVLGAGAEAHDSEEGYQIDLLKGRREPGLDRLMAFDIVRSAFEVRRLSDREFVARFATELASAVSGFPDLMPAEVETRLVDLHRRHGESVRDLFVRATEEYADQLVEEKLPDSCLLRSWPKDPGPTAGASIESSAEPIRSESSLEPLEPTPPRAVGELCQLALDAKNQQIVFDLIAPFGGPATYRLMSLLVDLHQRDRSDGKRPDNFSAASVHGLIDSAGFGGETNLRKAISRINKDFGREYRELYPNDRRGPALIENVRGKGYRLNPYIRVVALDQLLRE